MKKLFLLTTAIALTTVLFGQTSTKYVEIIGRPDDTDTSWSFKIANANLDSVSTRLIKHWGKPTENKVYSIKWTNILLKDNNKVIGDSLLITCLDQVISRLNGVTQHFPYFTKREKQKVLKEMTPNQHREIIIYIKNKNNEKFVLTQTKAMEIADYIEKIIR
jgi:hypothetical protein